MDSPTCEVTWQRVIIQVQFLVVSLPACLTLSVINLPLYDLDLSYVGLVVIFVLGFSLHVFVKVDIGGKKLFMQVTGFFASAILLSIG